MPQLFLRFLFAVYFLSGVSVITDGDTINLEEMLEICKNEGNSSSQLCEQLTRVYSVPNNPLTPSDVQRTGSGSLTNSQLASQESNKTKSSQQFQNVAEKIADIGFTLGTACENLERFKDFSKAASKISKATGKVVQGAKASTKVAKAAMGISKALGAMTTTLGALGQIASVLGPIGSAVGGVFSLVSAFNSFFGPEEESENEKLQQMIQEQFDKVHERFDKLEMKFGKLEGTVEKTVVYAGYIENQDRIHRVMFAHRMMLERITNKTIQEFQETCRLENPLFALDWIYRHALVDESSEFGPHLLPTVVKDVGNDRSRLLNFFGIMLSDMMTASYLREACIGIVFKLKGKALKKEVAANRKKMSQMISAVTRKMRVHDQKLLNELAVQVKSTVIEDAEVLIKKAKSDHWHAETVQGLVNAVKDVCSEKYFWLEWSVYAIETEQRGINGDEKHYIYLRADVNLFLYIFWTESENVDLAKKAVQVAKIESDKFAAYLADPSKAKSFVDNPEGIWILLRYLRQYSSKELNYGPITHEYNHGQSTLDVFSNKIVLTTWGIKSQHSSKGDNVFDYVYLKDFSDHWDVRVIISYYYSPTEQDTIGCRLDAQNLTQLNVTRDYACPNFDGRQAFEHFLKEKMNFRFYPVDKIAAATVSSTLMDFDRSQFYFVYFDTPDTCWMDLLINKTMEKYFPSKIPNRYISSRTGANFTKVVYHFGEFIVDWSPKEDQLIPFQVTHALRLINITVNEILLAHKHLLGKYENDTKSIMPYFVNNITSFIAVQESYCTYNNDTIARPIWYPTSLCKMGLNYFDNKMVLVIASRSTGDAPNTPEIAYNKEHVAFYMYEKLINGHNFHMLSSVTTNRTA